MSHSTTSEGRPLCSLPRLLGRGDAIATVRTVAAAPSRHRMPLRHVIMLALAAEVLVMGWCWADHYRRPGIVVDATFTEGHEIT